jgi:hypothetical protein
VSAGSMKAYILKIISGVKSAAQKPRFQQFQMFQPFQTFSERMNRI